jgi:hypothetical protein
MVEHSSEAQPLAVAGALTDVAELEALSSKKAYNRFLSAARAVDAGAVEECRANVTLAYYSAKRGLESLRSQEAELSRLPQVKLEDLQTLPQLAQGLAFAVLQWHRHLEAASFGPLFEQAQRSRRKLLSAADALAEAGLLADTDADAVRHLSRHDVIGTCLAFSELLRRNEARIQGRSPVTAAELEEAEQIVTKLRELLAPSGELLERLALPSLVEATQVRDRFWTLLKQRHDLLWRCGAWLYGQQVEEHVPPLQLVYTTLPRAVVAPQVQQSVLAPRPAMVEPLRQKTNPMQAIQRKIRALVSVSIGGRASR